MILTEGIRDASKIIRRYHSWTYGLDGNLLHVLGNEDFPNYDKKSFGLTEVEA